MSRPILSPGDIDRELDEIRDSYLGERNSLRACLRQAFEIGRADGRNAERAGDTSPCPDPTLGREYRHGGTTIHKVEIVITSDRDPAAIARHVRAELEKVSGRTPA